MTEAQRIEPWRGGSTPYTGPEPTEPDWDAYDAAYKTGTTDARKQVEHWIEVCQKLGDPDTAKLLAVIADRIKRLNPMTGEPLPPA